MKQSIHILLLLIPMVFQLRGSSLHQWIEAGDDITICESNNYASVNAQASGNGFVEWTSAGDGFFMLPNELSTDYFPGPNDTSSGSVILYISFFTSENTTLTDSLTLFIVRAPVSVTNSFASICENEICNLQGFSFYSTSFAWTTTGDGYFTLPFCLATDYIPGILDIASGSVDLCLISFPASPCIQPDVSCLLLNIDKIPQVDAGSDAVICKYDNYQLSALVQNCDTIIWITSGDGTFSNPNIADPVYDPGFEDENSESVILSITAGSFAPCQHTVFDSLVLNIQKSPVVYAGSNQTICKNQIAHLSGTAFNSSGILWTTYGDGIFDNDTILDPVYTPGQSDLNGRWLFLELTAFPVSPCILSAVSYLFIELQNLPTVFAGEDVTVCLDTLTLNGVAENYEEIAWSTNGDGTFCNIDSLNTDYSFGQNDLIAGNVVLTITAIPLFPCATNIFDEIVVVIDQPHVVNQIMNDTTLISGQPLTLHFEAGSITTGFYSWYFDGLEIPGEHSPSLIILEVGCCHAGKYRCVYSHPCGDVSSNICMVKIREALSQEFYLPAGWSGLSSFVIPQQCELDSIFEGLMGNLILLSDNSGIYFPAQSLNTLGQWMIPHGYQIKMEEPSYLVMDGFIEYPIQGISIPSGWSVLPFNYNQNVNVSCFFDTIPGVEIIKELAGINVFWPAMNINTLNELIPGRAYLVYNKTQNIIHVNFSLSGNKSMQRNNDYSFRDSIKISRILIPASVITVPGPKIATTPASYKNW